MTEEEAKTKWCPMVRVTIRHDDGRYAASHNRYQDDDVPTGYAEDAHFSCIGSACMMWRVVEKFGDGGCYQGYCGLAGGPHQS